MGLFKDITIDNDKFDNIVNDLDNHTETDEEFCKVFTERVFNTFGCKYTNKGVVEEYEDRYVDNKINILKGK
tara:strand:+ start:890 stop:1105 length:216 start_codon:yes stop_codon:yes gene_type:complete